MPSCEKCWDDAFHESRFQGGSQADIYSKLVKERNCTPEEQAGGVDAGVCPECKRKTLHRNIPDYCMACNKITLFILK